MHEQSSSRGPRPTVSTEKDLKVMPRESKGHRRKDPLASEEGKISGTGLSQQPQDALGGL